VGRRRVRLSGGDQAFGGLKELIKSRCTREDERGRVEHDAVADARGVGVGDEAVCSGTAKR
jgi:hypothetical protein